MWSIYLDDFTDVEIMEMLDALELIGTPSPNQLTARRAYERNRIPRNVDKALTRQLLAERLGYFFNGFSGWMGVSNQRSAVTLTLGLEALQLGACPLLLLQVLAGRLGHALQARRALWCYLYRFYELADESRPERVRFLCGRAKVELLGTLALMPQMGCNLRSPVDSVVTASDASERGLGVSRTVRLSSFGRESLAGLEADGDAGLHEVEHGPFKSDAVAVVISVFDGIGGLRRSLERLHAQVLVYLSIENETCIKRVVRTAWPGVIEGSDVCSVTRQDIEQVVRHALTMRCNLCVYGGGFPCQDVSYLNPAHLRIEGSRISLFRELARLARDTQELCQGHGLIFCGIAECVIMSSRDEDAVSKELGWPLVLNCPSGCSRNRRPRGFWVSVLPRDAPGCYLEEEDSHWRLTLLGGVEETPVWAVPGWELVGEAVPGHRLSTFTRAIPRSQPAWRGLQDSNAQAPRLSLGMALTGSDSLLTPTKRCTAWSAQTRRTSSLAAPPRASAEQWREKS